MYDLNQVKKELLADSGYYEIQHEDLRSVAKVMSNAFTKDPILNYLCGCKNFPEAHYDAEKAIPFFMNTLRCQEKVAISYAPTTEIEGVFSCATPDYKRIGVFDFLKYGGLKLPFVMDIGILFRLAAYEDFQYKLKKQFSRDNTWYLFALTVDPQHQGKHFGWDLMMQSVNYIVDRGDTAYLETHNPKNITLYEKMGFHVVSEDEVPKTGVIQYSMLSNNATWA